MKKRFSVRKRMKSFGYAYQGLRHILRDEHNFRIHLIAALVVVTLSVYFKICNWEWGLVVVAISMVWVAEAINTAIERLCDIVQPELHTKIKIIKDVAAFAVLVAAISAVVIGLIVFIPHVCNLF